MVINLLQI